jgi:hypothetical protein
MPWEPGIPIYGTWDEMFDRWVPDDPQMLYGYTRHLFQDLDDDGYDGFVRFTNVHSITDAVPVTFRNSVSANRRQAMEANIASPRCLHCEVTWSLRSGITCWNCGRLPAIKPAYNYWWDGVKAKSSDEYSWRVA